jgi:hypothetical protein
MAGVILALAALVAACGGDDGGSSNNGDSSSRPRATATRTSNGPTTSLNPKSGPPGIEVTATGSGWPPGVEVAITAIDQSQKPYTTAFTDRSGAFRASFFLEKKPDGSVLETGAMEIIATAGSVKITVPYIVEVRRPVSGPSGPGGG